jgi:hypothetical protein
MANPLLQRHFFVSCVRRGASARLSHDSYAFVHVAARLPPASMARLRAVLSPDEQLIEIADWRELHHALRSRPIDLMVLDPRAAGEEAIALDDAEEPSPLLTLLTEFRSVPAILYTTHTREGLRAVLPLARVGVHQVVFRGFDDARDRLRALLDEVAASVLGERLLAELLPRLATANAPAEVVEAIARLFRAPQAFRSVPAILYTSHTREGLRAVLPLARAGVHQVIFRGFDDSRDRLRALLDEVAASVLGERLLAELLPRLERANAPAEVVEAIARLFRAPQAFRSVHQLAAVAGRRRGQLDRWMLRAGLAPAKALMIAARVAWTHHYLRAPGNRFKTLALRLGYRDTVGLGRHVRWITGMTATELRRGVTADDLLPILLRRIVR